MKRREFLKCASLFGAALLCGCSSDSAKNQDGPYADTAVGLAETRSNAAPSCIHWLNNSLVEIGSTEIDQANLSGWNPPALHNGLLLFAPVGMMGKNDARRLVTLEPQSKEIQTYTVDTVNNYCVAAADNLAFIANNLNMESNVTRVNLADASANSVCLGSHIVDSVVAINDLLLVFSWDSGTDGENSKISMFDLDLNLLSETPLDHFGSGIERPRTQDGLVYFTPWTRASSAPEGSGIYGVFDIGKETLEIIDSSQEIIDAVPTSEGLVLIHGNIHANSASAADAELLEYRSWKKNSETRLPFATYQTEATGNDLIILDASDTLHRIVVGEEWEEIATGLIDRKYTSSYFSSITLL